MSTLSERTVAKQARRATATGKVSDIAQSGFKLTAKQVAANALLAGAALYIMLFGGSRSGKTFVLVRAVIVRALKSPNSRHAILRFRFNAVKNSVVLDTFPKVMKLCFPGIKYVLNKSDWYVKFDNGAEIWFAGLDDKERTEKILGMEFATLYFNETSQIPFASIEIALTRLAQRAVMVIDGSNYPLSPRAYFDCNPSTKAHWTFRMFVLKVHPDTKLPLRAEAYACMQMNPEDNAENLADGYLETLRGLSGRARKRFLEGEYAEANPNGLFPSEHFDKWRVLNTEDLPDMVRVLVAVDPSGADDEAESDNDAIGIVVGGLGTDGIAYIGPDLTVKAGPATWGRVATDAYDNHDADGVVGETNFGGAMVQHVIQTCRPRTPFIKVTASRGKAQRAEPFSALYEQGKVRHVGYLTELEEELEGFSTNGYTGPRSPNRADAAIWVLAALFPAIVAPKDKKNPKGFRDPQSAQMPFANRKGA